MNLLSVENISKSYGEKILFKDICFGIESGEKLGLIGINGTGKSTFLKVLSEIDTPDDGNIVKGNGVRIKFLSQNPDFNEDLSILEHVYADAKANIKSDEVDIWQIEADAKTILTKLGVNNFDQKINILSGGQKKRVALASALITPSDLLILDEPTNHLDNLIIEWLEQYLNKRKGALIMVTHDRYFLDRVANRIIELDRGSLYSYKGNYSNFVEAKLERTLLEEASEQKRQNLLRRELAWVRRGAQARSTKQKARLDRYDELKDRNPLSVNDKVDAASLNFSSRLGKKVIELKNIKKSFGETKIIDDFSYIFGKGDKIGIIGPNGIGKSTLINIMLEKLNIDSGELIKGDTVKTACFAQENESMDETLKVIDYIKQEAEFIETSDGEKISASKMLENFLFTSYAQWTPIGKLSGGEKRRLYLLKVLISNPNVLILDEPTNDLDIQTLTILEDFLDSFGGTLITVSHDRYFLDRTVDKLIIFEGNGKLGHYVGNYSEYQEYAKEMNLNSEVQQEEKSEAKSYHKTPKEKPLKFSFKEQKEYEEIDGVIEALENDLSTISLEIGNAGSNFVLLQELTNKQQEIENILTEKMDRWTYLNELAEKIEESKK